MSSPLRIKDLKIGQTALVKGYSEPTGSYRKKLLTFGLTSGTLIRLTKKAPMGDPVEIEVRGYAMSLRKDEADIIMLEIA